MRHNEWWGNKWWNYQEWRYHTWLWYFYTYRFYVRVWYILQSALALRTVSILFDSIHVPLYSSVRWYSSFFLYTQECDAIYGIRQSRANLVTPPPHVSPAETVLCVLCVSTIYSRVNKYYLSQQTCQVFLLQCRYSTSRIKMSGIYSNFALSYIYLQLSFFLTGRTTAIRSSQ